VVNPDPYTLDPSAGIIGDHDYTVVGIQNPSAGDPNATYVTLRNPWGIDTDPSYFDLDSDGGLDAPELAHFRKGLDGSNDGIIRVSWSDFQKYFSAVDLCQVTGPRINHPQGAPPTPNHPNPGPFTIGQGQTLGPIDLSAVGPQGQSVTYHVLAGHPGSVGSDGEYTWTVPPNAIGPWLVTVVAQSSPFSSIYETIEVDIQAVQPTVTA
jgi:hypothetical protein